jgi:hypothetical protein
MHCEIWNGLLGRGVMYICKRALNSTKDTGIKTNILEKCEKISTIQ